MKYVDHGSGGGPEVMMIREMPRPAPKKGQVLIKVAFAGVNRPDIFQRAGSYPPPPGASPILGLEVSGTIVDKDPTIDEWQINDQVCALTAGGGYAEFCVAESAICLPAPAGLDFAQAAALPENLFTVWTNLIDRGRLARGETVLIHGGASGIGYQAIQMAKCCREAKVLTTVGSEAKAEFCRALGADRVVNYRTQDFVRESLEATERRGVDLVLDMVGGDYIPRNLAVLRNDGRLSLIAFLRGSRVTDLDLRPVMTKRLTLTGSTLRPLPLDRKAAIARNLCDYVWPLLESGKMRVMIYQEFPLSEVQEAHRLMESGKHMGKIVLRA
jgi:NADPH:quinone reductase